MPPAPYDHLYIYEILGDARAAAAGLGTDYLGLWLEDGTSFLFFSAPAEARVGAILQGDPALTLRETHHLSYEQWQGGQHLAPLVLPGLMIVPAWQEPPAGFDGQVLRLDPGLVFGNGLHPTTKHCLELLLILCAKGPLGRVLDLGCGTGILGLAAALMGAQAVTCVDLNPLCVTTTARNAELNQLATVTVAEGPAGDFLDNPAEVVLANLHWEVQRELWRPGPVLMGKRDLILSGITRSQRDPLTELLAQCGYRVLVGRQTEGAWYSLWARREDPA